MTESKEMDMLYEDMFDYAGQAETPTHKKVQTTESMDVEESTDAKVKSTIDPERHHGDGEQACDDLDLYDDIIVEEDAQEKETYKEMLEKFGEAMSTISKLEAENSTLITSIKQLQTTSDSAQKNISSILLTARAEVKRKDTEINRLRKQLNGKSPFLRNQCKRYRGLNTSSSMTESDSSNVQENRHSSDDKASPKRLSKRNRSPNHSQSENSDSDRNKEKSSHSQSYKDRKDRERDRKSSRHYDKERREIDSPVFKSRHSKQSRNRSELDSEIKSEKHGDSEQMSDKSVHSCKEDSESGRRKKSTRQDCPKDDKEHSESDRERKSNRLESSRDEVGKVSEKEDGHTSRNSNRKGDTEKPSEKLHSRKHKHRKDSVLEKSYSSPSCSSENTSRKKSKERKEDKSNSRDTVLDRKSQRSSRSSTRLLEKYKEKQSDETKREDKERNNKKCETRDQEREKCENVVKGVFDLRQKLKSKHKKVDDQHLQERVEKVNSEAEVRQTNVEKTPEPLPSEMRLDTQTYKADSNLQDTISEHVKKSTVEKHRKAHKGPSVDLESDRLFLSQLLKSSQGKKQVTNNTQINGNISRVEQRGQVKELINDKTEKKKSELRRDVVDYCDIENEDDSNTETGDICIPDDMKKAERIKTTIELKRKMTTVPCNSSTAKSDKVSDPVNSDKEICESPSQDNEQTCNKEIQLDKEVSESTKQTSESSDTSLLYANIGNNNENLDETTSFDGNFDNEIFSLSKNRNLSPAKNKNVDAEGGELEECTGPDSKIEPALDVQNDSVLKINNNTQVETSDLHIGVTSKGIINGKSSQQKQHKSETVVEPEQSKKCESLNGTKDTVDNGKTQNVEVHSKLKTDTLESDVFKTSSQESENDKTSEEKQTKNRRRKSRESDSQKVYRRVISETISSVTSCELSQMETDGNESSSPVVPETLSPNRVCGKLNCSIKVNHLHPKTSPNPSPQKGKKLEIPHEEDDITDNCDKNSAPNNTEETTSAIPDDVTGEIDDSIKGLLKDKAHENERVYTETVQSEKENILTEQLSQNSGSSGSFGSNILTEQTKSPTSSYTSDSSESSDSEYTDSESESSVDSGNEDPSFERFSMSTETVNYGKEKNRDTIRIQCEKTKQSKSADTLILTDKVPTASTACHTAYSKKIIEEKETPENGSVEIVSNKQNKDAEPDENNGDAHGLESSKKKVEKFGVKENIKQHVKITNEIVKQVGTSAEKANNQSLSIQKSDPHGEKKICTDTAKVHNVLTQSPDKSFLLQSLLSGVESVLKAKQYEEDPLHTENDNDGQEKGNHNVSGVDSQSSRRLSEFELFGSPLSSSGSDSEGDTESTSGSTSSSCGCSSCSCGSSSSSSISDSSTDDSSESETEEEINKEDDKSQSTDNKERQTESNVDVSPEGKQASEIIADGQKKQASEINIDNKEKQLGNVDNKERPAHRNVLDGNEEKQPSEVNVDRKAKQSDNSVHNAIEAGKQTEAIDVDRKAKQTDNSVHNAIEAGKQTEEIDVDRKAKQTDNSVHNAIEAGKQTEAIDVDRKVKQTDNSVHNDVEAGKQTEEIDVDRKTKQTDNSVHNDVEAGKQTEEIDVDRKAKQTGNNVHNDVEAGKQTEEIDVDRKAKQTGNNVHDDVEAGKQTEEIDVDRKVKQTGNNVHNDVEAGKQTEEIDVDRKVKQSGNNVHNAIEEKQTEEVDCGNKRKHIESSETVSIKDKHNTKDVESKKEKISDNIRAASEEKQADSNGHISKSKQTDGIVHFELNEKHNCAVNSKNSAISDSKKIENQVVESDKNDKRTRKSSDDRLIDKSHDVSTADVEVETPEKESANGYNLTAKEISPCILKICRKSRSREKEDSYEKNRLSESKVTKAVEETAKIKTQPEKEPKKKRSISSMDNSKKRGNSNKPDHQLHNKTSGKDNTRQLSVRRGNRCDIMNVKSTGKSSNTSLKGVENDTDVKKNQMNIARHSSKNKTFETTNAKIASLSGRDVANHSTKTIATVSTASDTQIPPAKIKEFLGKARLAHGKVTSDRLNRKDEKKSFMQNVRLSEKLVPKSQHATNLNKNKPGLSTRAQVASSMNRDLGNKKTDTGGVSESVDTISKQISTENTEKQSSKEKIQSGNKNLSRSDRKRETVSVDKMPIVPVTSKKKETDIKLKDCQKHAKSAMSKLKRLSPERALREVTSFHLDSYKIPKRKPEQLNKKAKEPIANHKKGVLDKRKGEKREESRHITSKVVTKSQNKSQEQSSTGKDRHSQNKTVLHDAKSSKSSDSLKRSLIEKTSDLKSRRTSLRQSTQRTVKSKEMVSSTETDTESDTTDSSDSELSYDSDGIVEAIFGKSSSSPESERSMKHSDICRTRNGDSTERPARELDTASSTIEKIVSRKRPRKISSDTDPETSDIRIRKSSKQTSESHPQNQIPGEELVSPRTNILHQASKLVTEMIENKLDKDKTKVIKSPDATDNKKIPRKSRSMSNNSETNKSAKSEKKARSMSKNSETDVSEISCKKATSDKKQASRSPKGLQKQQSSVAESKTSNKEADMSVSASEMDSQKTTDKAIVTETSLEKNNTPSNTVSENDNLVKQVSTEKELPKKTKIQQKENNNQSVLSLDLHSEDTVLDFIDCTEEMGFGDECDSSAESDSSSSSSGTSSSSEEGELSDDSEAEPIPFKRSPTKPFKLFQENTASAEKLKLKNVLNFSSVGAKKFSPIKFPISSGLESAALDTWDVRTPPHSGRLDKRRYRSDSDPDSEGKIPLCRSAGKHNSSARRRIISSNEQNVRHDTLPSRRNKHFESPKLVSRHRSRSRSPRLRRERSLERCRNRDRDNGRSDSDQSRRRRKGASRDSSRDSSSDKEGRHRLRSKTYKSRSVRDRQNSNSSHYDSNSESRMNKAKSSDKSDRHRSSVSDRKKVERCDREDRYKTRESDKKEPHEIRDNVRREKQMSEREERHRMRDSRLDNKKKPEKRKGKDVSHGKAQAKDSGVVKEVHGKSHKKVHNSSSDNEELLSRRKAQKRKHNFRSSTDYETDSEHSGAEKQSTPVVKKKRKDL